MKQPVPDLLYQRHRIRRTNMGQQNPIMFGPFRYKNLADPHRMWS